MTKASARRAYNKSLVAAGYTDVVWTRNLFERLWFYQSTQVKYDQLTQHFFDHCSSWSNYYGMKVRDAIADFGLLKGGK